MNYVQKCIVINIYTRNLVFIVQWYGTLRVQVGLTVGRFISISMDLKNFKYLLPTVRYSKSLQIISFSLSNQMNKVTLTI